MRLQGYSIVLGRGRPASSERPLTCIETPKKWSEARCSPQSVNVLVESNNLPPCYYEQNPRNDKEDSCPMVSDVLY